MQQSNFTHLRAHDEQLVRLDLLRRLQDQGIVSREVGGLFIEMREPVNDANHRSAGDHRTATDVQEESSS